MTNTHHSIPLAHRVKQKKKKKKEACSRLLLVTTDASARSFTVDLGREAVLKDQRHAIHQKHLQDGEGVEGGEGGVNRLLRM